jgi:hypothetical protein
VLSLAVTGSYAAPATRGRAPEIATIDIEYVADLVLLPLAIDFYLYQRQRPGFTPERITAGLEHFLLHSLALAPHQAAFS